MNMIYKDETLYIDIIDNNEIDNISHIKRQLFSVLNQYEVSNVVVNIMGGINYNRGLMNDLICDYHRNYTGSLIVDVK